MFGPTHIFLGDKQEERETFPGLNPDFLVKINIIKISRNFIYLIIF